MTSELNIGSNNDQMELFNTIFNSGIGYLESLAANTPQNNQKF